MANDTTKKYTINSGNDLELFKRKFNTGADKAELETEKNNMLNRDKEPENNKRASGSHYAQNTVKSITGMPSKSEEYETRMNYAPVYVPTKQYAENMAIGRDNSPEQVKKIQSVLGIKVDGIYGPETRNAVLRFQRDNNLLVDGIAGSQTLGKLFRYTNGTGMENKYSTYQDTSTARRDENSSSVIPSTGMESKQSTYNPGEMPKKEVAVPIRGKHWAIPNNAEKNYTIEEKDNQPSWGKVVGSSLGSGVAQTNASMFNVPRKIIEGVSIGLDKVMPDFIYNKEMQNNDPIKKALDKAVKSNEERAMQYQKDLEGAKGIKGFVAAGLPALPQIVMAAAGGVAANGSSALSGLSTAAKQLIPFGTLAAGGYAREAENEGASYGQQVAYGLLGGTAEAATEVIPLGNALNLMKKFGAGEIAEKGAKTLIGKYGKTVLQIIGTKLSEGLQEAIMSPVGRAAQKITYKPDMGMTGEGGVWDWKDIGNSAYGGISMAVILGGLALPSTYASHKLATKMIEGDKPITPGAIEKEMMPALQKDINSMESESIQGAKIKQAPAEFDWALRQVVIGKNIPAALEAKYPVLAEFSKNLEEERNRPAEIQKQTRENESNAIAEDYNSLFETPQASTSEVKNKPIETIEQQEKVGSKVPIESNEKTEVEEPTAEVKTEEEIPEVETEKPKNIGYHAGDLGKAEHYGRQYGSNRGTGHFGTGTYFVGDKKNIEIGNYKDRPMHEVDLSDYKLFKPKNESEARKLHDLLKYANNYYRTAQSEMVPDELLDDLKYSEPDTIISELKNLGKWDEEKFQDYFNISSDEYVDKKLERQDIYNYLRNDLLSEIENDNERIKRALNYKEEFEDTVEGTLGISKEKATEMLDNIYKDIKKQYGSFDWTRNKDLEKSDSVSTRLMKVLGYEGVDVRHIPSYDNTGFGTVVYDLKESGEQKPTQNTPQELLTEEKPKEVETIIEGDKQAQKDDKTVVEDKPIVIKNTLSDYGLTVNQTKTNKGNDVWQVPSNESTKQYVPIFHKLKARWYKPHPKAKGVWSFNYDPTKDLLKEILELEGNNVSSDDANEPPKENISISQNSEYNVGKENPSQNIANKVKASLEKRETIKANDLIKWAEEAYGSKLSEGKYDRKQVHDAMELGVNQYLLENKKVFDTSNKDINAVISNIDILKSMVGLLSTQTNQTQEMKDFQQFSTPPHIAYVAAFAGNIDKNDTMLEPSAGIGGIATFAKINDAKVVVNELSQKRLEILENMGFDEVYNENAEHINSILHDKVKPTVIVMNPPFSATAGRMGDKNSTKNAKAHMEQALDILQDGGRLVAIVGQGMADNSKAFADWWEKIKTKYNVRANISLYDADQTSNIKHTDEYKKYGTTFGIQLIVIDKTGPTQSTLVANEPDLKKVINLLVKEGIYDDRQRNTAGNQEGESAPGKHDGKADIEKTENGNRGQSASPGAVNELGNRKPEGGTSGVNGSNGSRNEGDSGRGNIQYEPKPQDNNEISGTGRKPGNTNVGTEGEKDSEGSSRVSSGEGDKQTDRKGDNIQQHGGTEVRGLEVESTNNKKVVEKELNDSVYDTYIPSKLKIKGSKEHPGELSESAAMAAVEPPEPTYSPKLPKEIVEKGMLSLAQLESVVYAGQAHSQMLPDGTRRGFFLGDGTGVGKGRQISGIILDNFAQGRKKAVWISKNEKLFDDAKRDWTSLGNKADDVFYLGKTKLGQNISAKNGILFTPYDTLATNMEVSGNGELAARGGKPSRLDQIVNWLGKDYDGVIVFDEAHMMANSITTKGKRGNKKPSARGLAGVELQKRLPKARVVYVSATGATEVANLAYADRLGLWGRGTDFADKNDFINKISEGGLAAMELIARDMKAMGVYLARTLSFKGIEYETLEHNLTKDQVEIYDAMAEAWQIVLQNIGRALQATGAVDEDSGKTLNSNAKKNAMGAFWGAQQRFFNQILTSMQMPSVIEAVKKDIAEGKSVVMQLVNTNEATQNRQIARLQDEEAPLEDLDLTPRDILLQYLDKSFPTEQYEPYIDEYGNERSRPVLDSKGNPVLNPEAVRLKQELLEKIGSLKVPEGPLEYILNTFGADKVAEITGRSQRIVNINGKAKLEKRSARHVAADADAFMDDKKQILIFSDAGGTGKSYHADKTRKNQRRRVHYLIQAGWRADSAVQGFGRTHRTNQSSAPIYRLVTTNLKGQKRFISSIARRLDQLGALTKGQRQTGSQGLFKASDNLEGPLAGDALRQFYKDLTANRIDKLEKNEIIEKMGLQSMLDEYGRINESSTDLRDVPKFLNRILSLDTSTQNYVFDAFTERLEALTEAAIAKGMLDTGLENYKADKVIVLDEKVVYEDEKTKAKTKYYELEAYHKNHPAPFKKYNKPDNENFIGFYKNSRSGNIRAAYKAGNITTEYGSVDEAYRLYGQVNDSKMSIREFDKSNWEKVDTTDAETLWDEAVAKVPEFKTEKLYMISGTILPIWGRLPRENVKVIRTATDKGILLGRIIHQNNIDATLRNLNTQRQKGETNIAQLVDQILEDGYKAVLVNGWTIERRKVSGDWRIELIGRDLYAASNQLKEDGVYTEYIQYTTRYFIPTGERAVDVINKITEYRPIVDVLAPDNMRVRASAVQSLTGTLPQMPQGNNTATLGGKDGAKTIDEIVAIIEKAIGVPIRTGKFRQKAYGIFKQLPEVIRTKVTNDLPTISHEVGHYLDKKYTLALKQFDTELQALGQPTSRKSYTDEEIRAEGVAEFVRLYLTEPQQATSKAPNFLAHFETVLDTDLLKELNDLRREIGKVNNLPPTQKILNDISIGESRRATKENSISGFLQKFYDAWLDEFAPITRAYRRAINEGWTGKNVNIMAKLYRGFEAKVKANLKYSQTDLAGNVVGDSLENILKPVRKQYKEFITYMVSRRAVDYENRGFVLPQPYWVYQDNVAELEAKYSHFKDVFDSIRKWEDNNLQLLVDSGIMTQQTVDDIKENNPNHVPLYRIQEAVDTIRAGSGNTLGQSKKVIKKAKGSGKTIIDPIESIIADAFIIRRAAEANSILGVLADMADNIEGFGDVMEAVPPGVKGTTFNVEEISKTLEDMGIDTEGVDLDKLVTIFRVNYSERPNEITVYRKGKPKLYQMESEIYKAIKGLNRQASHFLIRLLNVPKRVIQAGAVTTVNFVMRNMARDTQTSLMNSEAGINPLDIMKGYVSAIKKDKWFKLWIQSGGASEYLQVADRTNVQDLEADILGINFIDMMKELIKKPTKENVVRVLLSPVRTIREGIEWSESGPRIAEMRKGVEKGISKDEATAWSRDLSQDFLRYGYYGKELNKVTAFFNANVQGIEKMGRVFKEHPYRTLLRGLLYVTLPTMILYFWNDDNDEYKRMAAWRKALFYNIPLGNRKTAQHFLSIPKPYGWGYIFGTLPELILDEIQHNEPDTWKNIKEGFATNFNIPLMPSAVGPTFDVAVNKSWNQTPIETQGDKQKPAYLRHNDRTSTTSKVIANAAKNTAPISPKQLDYLVKGYTGPVGDFFWRLPDTIKKGVQTPDDYTNYPVVKSFITDTAYSNDTLDKFYNYGAELNERKKEAQETGSYRAISHLSEDVQKQLSGSLKNARLEYNRIADDFTDARKKVAEINASDKYTPAQKKLMTREIQMKIVKKAETYNKKYEQFKQKYEIK